MVKLIAPKRRAVRAKLCIFCGLPLAGQKRSFEHVIPKWLVEEADLKKRTMEVPIGNRIINVAMSRVGTKCCDKCNSDFSGLEARAKVAYSAVRDGEVLSSEIANDILDWFDKIRVGLWLWSLEVTKDQHEISPKFSISSRLANKDRLLLIQKYPSDPKLKGLQFWGLGENFWVLPSVIGFFVNNVAFVSCSSDFLILRNLKGVRVQRKLTGNLEELDVGGAETFRRLRFLGDPYILAQYCMPKSFFEDYAIEEWRSADDSNEMSRSSPLRLSPDLREVMLDLGFVPEFDGNYRARIALMEYNTAIANLYLSDDFNRADISSLSFAEKSMHSFNRRHISEIVNYMLRVAGSAYHAQTGIRLPKPI